MRTCSVLCAIAALCVVQMTEGMSNNNQVLKNRVRDLTATASSTANSLIRFKERAESDLDIKLTEAKTYYTKEVSDFVTLDLEAVRNAADAAKAEGRNADNCFRDTKTSYDVLLISAHEDLDKCIASSTSILGAALEHVQATIGVAQNDANELKTIIAECKSSNQQEERSCLSSGLHSASANVNNLRSTAVRVQQAAETASTEALDKAHICLPPKLDSVRNAGVHQRFQASECIKNAV